MDVPATNEEATTLFKTSCGDDSQSQRQKRRRRNQSWEDEEHPKRRRPATSIEAFNKAEHYENCESLMPSSSLLPTLPVVLPSPSFVHTYYNASQDAVKLHVMSTLQNPHAGMTAHLQSLRFVQTTLDRDEATALFRCILNVMLQYVFVVDVQLEAFRSLRFFWQIIKSCAGTTPTATDGSTATSIMNTTSNACVPQTLLQSTICTIITIVKSHLSLHSPEVQSAGLEMLESVLTSKVEDTMTISTSGTTREHLDIDVIQVTLQAMQINLADRQIQKTGTSLLSWIVEEESQRKAVIDCMGITCTLQALKEHQSDSFIQCNGIATLCWLIHRCGQDARTQFLQAPNGLETLVRTTRQYMDQPSILGNCLCLLSAFTNTAAISSESTMQMVLDIMKQHSKSVKVQRNCLHLLRQITARNITRIIQWFAQSNNGIDQICSTMFICADDANIQAQACGLLANLCSSCPTVRNKVLASNCLEAVSRCQFRHRHVARVRHAAAWLQTCILVECIDRSDVQAFGGGAPVIQLLLSDTTAVTAATSAETSGRNDNGSAAAGPTGQFSNFQT